MMDRVFPVTSARVDFGAWCKANVSEGDVVRLADGATWWTEAVRIADAPPFKIDGAGATFVSKNMMPSASVGGWPRGFEVVRGRGVEVYDLNLRAPRAEGLGYLTVYEGNHAFAFVGTQDAVACRCSAEGFWGDHVYIADDSTNIVVCQFDGSFQTGRHGVACVAGEDILVYDSDFRSTRTGLNFEVHPDHAVRRYHAENLRLHWGLMAITGTGRGEASDVTLRNIWVASDLSKLTITVQGPGLTGDYGPRKNWVLDGFSGGKPTKDPKYIKLHYIDGLSVTKFPYRYTTTGSVLT